MEERLTFDDVLILPQWSELTSRKDVSLETKMSSWITPFELKLPIISANMDTVTGVDMCVAMHAAGGIGCLHRFWSIEENVKAFQAAAARCNGKNPMVCFGLGQAELDRAIALFDNGARLFIIDVAHAAQRTTVEQYIAFKSKCPTAFVVVGNFASVDSLNKFFNECTISIDAVKIGIGPGSACTTRIKTGCGVPQLSAIIECAAWGKTHGVAIIADGGMKTPGDIAKALAAGASAVMLGGMLAGANETPGKLVHTTALVGNPDAGFREVQSGKGYKVYRGSASKEAYEDQGKDQAYITAEGEAFKVEAKGPVANILKDIEGGVRSALTYVGAKNLYEFARKAKFTKITAATTKENGAHGKL